MDKTERKLKELEREKELWLYYEWLAEDIEREHYKPPYELIVLAEAEAVKRGKRRDPKDYPKNYAVLLNHFRGKSAHVDFRRKVNDHLEGETILNQPEGLITEDVDTIEKARKWNKVLLEKGKFRPDMDPNKKAVLVQKATQPLGWLNVREVIIEPGSVGATKFEVGGYITMDEGMAYPGVSKAYFKEFFLDMKHFKGRMVERLLGVRPEWKKPPKAAVQWQCWFNLVDQTPYILSKRGRTKKDYVPKEEEKAIPPEWEEKIKEEHRWWIKDLKPKERMRRLDLAFNDLVEREIIKARPIEIKESDLQEKIGKFTLRFHWWMGPKVVREMPATGSHHDLVIDTGKDYLDEWNLFGGKSWGNPLTDKTVTAKRKECRNKTPKGEPNKEWINFEGSIPANDSKVKAVKVIKEIDTKYLVEDKKGTRIETKETFAKFKAGQEAWFDQWNNLYTGKLGGTIYENPNERLPVFMEIVDTGEINWIEDTPLFSHFEFKGKKLKGRWVMKRTDPKSDIWVFSKGTALGEKLEETINLDVTGSSFPIKIKNGDEVYELVKTGSQKLLLKK